LEFLNPGSIGALLQVVMIDLVLAGDNAIVIGMAAAGLHGPLRRRAILIGIGAATVMRILFALVATQLLALTGLLLAGGLLLLWVAWKMWQDLRGQAAEAVAEPAYAFADGAAMNQGGGKTLRQAVTQIVIADLSMSLDNVLAVAGAARDHFEALIFGLALSVVLMGVASAYIGRLLNRFRWIAWIGLVIILYVALRMIYGGADDVMADGLPNIPFLSESTEHAPAA
jgi:YjbE family integral membrane protein